MNDIALWLPALILPLFCLIYSVAARRELYFPMPKGLSANARDQHTVFLAILVVLIVAAVASAAEALGGTAFAAAGLSGPFHTAGIALRVGLFGLLALYIRALDRPDAKAIPIIALTANAFEEDVQQCLQAGMNAHLSKPVDIDALVSALGRLIAQRERSAE